MVGQFSMPVDTSLSTLEGAKVLYENRIKYGSPAELLFEDFSSGLGSESKRINLLIEFLKKIGIGYNTFGRDYNPAGKPEPQILFVDLKLNEREVRLEQPVKVVKKLKELYPQAHPLIFLMSSLHTSLIENREQFRIECELLTTQFEVLLKNKFQNEDDLALFLSHHINVYPQLRLLQAHILAWGMALDAAKQKLQETLRSLDLPDYFVLYSNTVTIEQVPLGTYVTDLLLEYIAHEIEASPGVSAFAKDLDCWKLSDITRLRFNVAPVVGDVFSANVLHAFPRIEAEADRGRGPKDGYLNLGDVFFVTEELEAQKVKTAYVVLSPACDLVRPDVLIQRKASIFLCEGEVAVLKPSTVLKEVDGLYPVILRYPYESGQQYTISWQKKRPQIWRYDQLELLRESAKPKFTHVGRLRPSYSLQLQHLVTSDLSRIGVQRPPDVYVPHGVEVLIADSGKWKLLIKTFREDPTAGAISHNKGARRQTFMLSDVLVREALKELREWIQRNPTKPGISKLKQLAEITGIDRSLISYVHEEVEQRDSEIHDLKPNVRGAKYTHLVLKKHHSLYSSRKRYKFRNRSSNSRFLRISNYRTKGLDGKPSSTGKSSATSALLIRPLLGADRLPNGSSNDIAESIIFAQQGRKVDDQFNGGKQIAAGIEGLLVFRFVKIS